MQKLEDDMNGGDDAIARIEALIEAGHTKLAPVLRMMIELQGCKRDFSDGNVIVGIAFNAIDRLLDGLEASAPATPSAPMSADEFGRRARLLAANVMEIGFDEQGQFEFHDIMDCQVQARRLLTGVDEGPYTGRTDEKHS